MIAQGSVAHSVRWDTGWVSMAVLILLFGAGAIGALTLLEDRRPPQVRAAELSYLPKGEYLRVASLGYRQMVGDLIWLKAVQHFGEREQTRQGYLWAYHAVDVVTDLDPKFWLAYHAGGTILGVWAGLVEESITLLKKGMRHNPDVWQLPFIVGYDYFYELCDPAQGAKYFQIASTKTGAPSYLPKLAARLSVEAGDPDAALEFLERFKLQVKDERLRDSLSYHIKAVIAERDIRFLEEGVRRYKARYGSAPSKLSDLVRKGIIGDIPPEPFGGLYSLNPSQGRVISSGLRERLRVHRRTPCSVVQAQHRRGGGT